MKYFVAKLVVFFLSLKVAFIVVNDFPYVDNELYILFVALLATSIGYLFFKIFLKGIFSVLEDHRTTEEQKRDPIL